MINSEDELKAEFQENISKYISDNDTDLIFYRGEINRYGYFQICNILENINKHSKVILMLETLGGDPNAAYRIARAIIHHYGAKNFKVAISSYCKSAGTLLCVGATELIFFDKGEMGPLDVQIFKQDEIFQRSSGLDLLRGMSYLNSEALRLFQSYLHDISRQGGISTKTASEISANIIKGLYTPIYGQIEPLRIGEMNAALQIAKEYGTRLNDKSKALVEYALDKLIHAYPTHDFVIDRAEARTLFNNVSSPDDDLKEIYEQILWLTHSDNRLLILDLKTFSHSQNPNEQVDYKEDIDI